MKTIVVLLSILLSTTVLYAGNGDLIVNGNIGVGTASPGRSFTLSSTGEPALQFLDQRAGAGNKSAGFVYDGGIALTRPGIIYQGFTDAGGWAGNRITFFRDGSINFGGIAAPDIAGQVAFTGGNVGIGTTSPGRLFTLSCPDGQPTMQFVDQRGSDGNKSAGFVYDAGIALTKPGIIYQDFTDTGGFTANRITFFRDGSINFGGITAPDAAGRVAFTSGRVGIGTTSPAYKLHVQGGFAVTGSKNFDIQDPRYDDPKRRLIHSSLEGPEVGVYYRGEATLADGRTTVVLPSYFEALTRQENRTVHLTPKFEFETEYICNVAASEVKDGEFTIRAFGVPNPAACAHGVYWEVRAERNDIERLVVEKNRDTPSAAEAE